MANVPVVFVSSTREDLQAERKAVTCAISRLCLPQNSMETFGASPQPPIDRCLERVAQCDVMVLIVGHRYGRVPNGSQRSYTQQEYEHAKQSGKSILAYIKSDDSLVYPKHVERDTENNRRLDEFKAALCDERTVSYFRDELQLAVQVAIDLASVAQEFTRGPGPVGRSRAAKKVRGKKIPAVRCADQALTKKIKTACTHINLRLKEVDELLDLDQYGVLIIVGSGYRKPLALSNQEVQHVIDFVRDGGGLLCAGQAWSWAYRRYGNMPVEMYPLNVIGRELGFLISGRNIGKPDGTSCDSEVFGDFTEWQGRDKWAPSEIRECKPGVEPVLKDVEKERVMAAKGTYGHGRFVVLGHEGMLVHNPDVLPHIVRFLTEKSNAR